VNLLLFERDELRPDGTLRLDGRRARHVAEVLRAAPGDRISVGEIGGRVGDAEVLASSPEELRLAPSLGAGPPAPSPVDLLVALPRPKILRRVLQAAAAMGVKRIELVGSWRVEKSYWGSPLLEPAPIREQLLLGLEQGRDTVLPEVGLHRLFKPFVEDRLDERFPGASRLLARSPADPPVEAAGAMTPRAVVAIGPEGGWTSYEAALLVTNGFAPFSLGPRTLRVDQAVPYAVAQVELALRALRRNP
jgi:16S rRNA (uracil1498-N3)-methyltransferase